MKFFFVEKFQEATKEGKPEQSVEDKMKGIENRRKINPPPANAMAERINPNKTPLGAKASRKAGLEQTLTNGNCKAKENDEPHPPIQ